MDSLKETERGNAPLLHKIIYWKMDKGKKECGPYEVVSIRNHILWLYGGTFRNTAVMKFQIPFLQIIL